LHLLLCWDCLLFLQVLRPCFQLNDCWQTFLAKESQEDHFRPHVQNQATIPAIQQIWYSSLKNELDLGVFSFRRYGDVSSRSLSVQKQAKKLGIQRPCQSRGYFQSSPAHSRITLISFRCRAGGLLWMMLWKGEAGEEDWSGVSIPCVYREC